MSALSFGRRNNLGAGLPSWAIGVTVPISTNPKPSASSSRRYFAFYQACSKADRIFKTEVENRNGKVGCSVSFSNDLFYESNTA